VELSIPFLHQLAEELPAVAGLLLRKESRRDFSLHYDAAEAEEPLHQEVAEVAEAEEEVEEHQLLRSPRPRLRRLSLKQPTFEQWEPPLGYSKEIEPRPRTSSTNSDIITVSTEGLLDLTPL
jgi:hypothetical protein